MMSADSTGETPKRIDLLPIAFELAVVICSGLVVLWSISGKECCVEYTRLVCSVSVFTILAGRLGSLLTGSVAWRVRKRALLCLVPGLALQFVIDLSPHSRVGSAASSGLSAGLMLGVMLSAFAEERQRDQPIRGPAIVDWSRFLPHSSPALRVLVACLLAALLITSILVLWRILARFEVDRSGKYAVSSLLLALVFALKLGVKTGYAATVAHLSRDLAFVLVTGAVVVIVWLEKQSVPPRVIDGLQEGGLLAAICGGAWFLFVDDFNDASQSPRIGSWVAVAVSVLIAAAVICFAPNVHSDFGVVGAFGFVLVVLVGVSRPVPGPK